MITGKSGTGKSTLLYHLGLLDEPTSGEVFIDGIDVSTMHSLEKINYRLNNFGFVFQDSALIPELTAQESIALPDMMRGLSKEEAYAKAAETLEILGLGNRLHHTPSQLSGGEAQRVSIARSIVHKPAILFADEPTANLDSERSQQIIEIFRGLHTSGQTIIIVTHELELVKDVARLITIHDGLIVNDTKN